MSTTKAKELIAEYVSKFKPLDQKRREAWYQYSTTGDKKASEREAFLTLAVRKLGSDRARFERLKEIYRDRDQIADPFMRREIELIYYNHLPNQVPEDKIEELTAVEKRLHEGFNDYAAEVDGKKLSAVDVSGILSKSTDSRELEKVWKAQHAVGRLLEKDYRELVRLKNWVARDLGYEDALSLASEVSELSLDVIERFYDELHRVTEKPLRRLKEEYIDPRLAKRYGISAGELQVWHYQNAYFQEAPTAIFEAVDMNALYRGIDSDRAIAQATDFYASMGVDVGPIIKNSSLFPKPGKNQHAVAELIDPERPDSAALIMSLPNPPQPPRATEVSMLIHELGHNINHVAIAANSELPYLLKDPSMLTEAFAMLMEKQTFTMEWFEKLGVPEGKAKSAVEAAGLFDYVDQMLFLRWANAIFDFERQFYADPDLDIGDLWWECRSKHQLLKRPDGWSNPDALAKYHIPNVEPLYYANYAIGRVANAQFADLFARRIGAPARGASYWGRKDLGAWLMKDFLAQGRKYRWDAFLRMSTGEPLSVEAWAKYYIGSKAEAKLYA